MDGSWEGLESLLGGSIFQEDSVDRWIIKNTKNNSIVPLFWLVLRLHHVRAVVVVLLLVLVVNNRTYFV